MKVDATGWLMWDLECSMYSEDKVKGSFYKRAKELLCIATHDLGTGVTKLYAEDTLEEGVQAILDAPRLVGHNIRGFDIPALGHLRPNFNKQLRTIPLSDTRWMALKSDKSPDGLYTYSQLDELDKKLGLETEYPNSLASWGDRFKFPKMSDFKNTNWETQTYTPLLGKYCETDVAVNVKLFEHICKKKGIEY
jgi:hypothetical protein|tara:strand:- start:172 stop:750 length:579 start_codon:yes stop_codon:yes gene_type:complete